MDWLKTEKLWGLDDPLFPATLISLGGNQQFEVAGLDRKHWSSAGPIRAIFKEAFEAARLPYFNPHSFRKTLALLGERVCRTPEEFKAWSQNLGHEKVLTTFSSYGEVAHSRQAAIIRGLVRPRAQGTRLVALAQQIIAEAQHAEDQSGMEEQSNKHEVHSEIPV